MSKRLTKEQIFINNFGDCPGMTNIQHKAVKQAALKAMSEYAAQQVKPWRRGVREIHKQLMNLKSWE